MFRSTFFLFGILFLGNAMSAQSRILVHGHRGARAMRPENTIPAFEYAIDQGVDAIEMDVAVTKDEVLVISHDPVLSPEICRGLAGTKGISDMTLVDSRRSDCSSLGEMHS